MSISDKIKGTPYTFRGRQIWLNGWASGDKGRVCCVVSLRFLFMKSMAGRLKRTHTYTWQAGRQADILPQNRCGRQAESARTIAWHFAPRPFSWYCCLLFALLCFGIYVCVFVVGAWGRYGRWTRPQQQIYYIFVFLFPLDPQWPPLFRDFDCYLQLLAGQRDSNSTVELCCWRRDQVHMYLWLVVHTFIH